MTLWKVLLACLEIVLFSQKLGMMLAFTKPLLLKTVSMHLVKKSCFG